MKDHTRRGIFVRDESGIGSLPPVTKSKNTKNEQNPSETTNVASKETSNLLVVVLLKKKFTIFTS